MNTTLDKKTLILTIVKFAIAILMTILFVFLPIGEGASFGLYIYLYIAALFEGSIEVLMFLPTMIAFLVFVVFSLVKSIMIFVDMLKVNSGKIKSEDVNWKKKFKLASALLYFIFFMVSFLMLFRQYTFSCPLTYIAIVFFAGDMVVTTLLKKQLGISKKQKGGKGAQQATAPAATQSAENTDSEQK
ncbi:MAG: hypothetical protein NC350_00035 [Corallococcus sp.]|nr:hypothetical protein [Corallococcus sp.]